MSVPALRDDLNPEAEALEQLTLDGDAFNAVVGLAAAGGLTVISLDLGELHRELSYDEYESIGAWLGRMNRSCSWWIGDWLLHGEGAFPDRYTQAQDVTGLARQTLLNRVYVCQNVPPSRRRARLAFSVHAEVAPLGAKEQKLWLDRAEKSGWSQRDLRAAMKATRKDTKPSPEGDDGEHDEEGILVQVARAILRDARPAEDGAHHLIPNEDIARLRAAMGEED